MTSADLHIAGLVLIEHSIMILAMDGVNDYGHLWHKRLRELWMDKQLNLSKVAKMLGFNITIIKKQATRWNLPIPKPGQIVRKGSENSPPWIGRRKTPDLRQIKEARSQWLSIIGDPIYKNVTSIVKRHVTLYHYLLRHDRSWMVAHPLRTERRLIVAYSVDWNDRDKELAEIVKSTASALKRRPGKPIRVRQSAICREANISSTNCNHKNRMPEFVKALQMVTETELSFAVRRIAWAAMKIKSEGIPVTRTELIRLAGTSARKLSSDPIVKAAVSDACLK